MAESTRSGEGAEVSLPELARRAGPIAKNSHLDSLNLRSLNVQLRGSPDEQRDVRLQSKHAVDFSFAPETEEALGGLAVGIHFDLTVESQEGDVLFTFEASFEANYSLNRGMPAEMAENLAAFAQTNAVVHAWPYYREIVQSMTWRMGLPPFPMPLFRITDQKAVKGPETL